MLQAQQQLALLEAELLVLQQLVLLEAELLVQQQQALRVQESKRVQHHRR
jgi:hypothetical protein